MSGTAVRTKSTQRNAVKRAGLSIVSPAPVVDNPDEFRLWDTDEAAKALKVSPSWLKRSDCPYVKLGALRRYDPVQVRAFARARRSHRIKGDEQ
jgi:hypothetical protein